MLQVLYPIGAIYAAALLSKIRPALILPLEEGCTVGVDSYGVYLKVRVSGVRAS